jgi:hypothetical protein
MTESDESEPRKRGAQPGNRNAVQHGFYARQLAGFTRDHDPSDGLTDQIAMLRLSVREIALRAESEPSPKADLEVLRAVTAACIAIHRLVKAQRKLFWKPKNKGNEPQLPLPASPTQDVSNEDLADARVIRVDQEVDLLTSLIERVTSQQSTWKTLGQSAAVVRALALANGVLASLTRTQRSMGKPADPLTQALQDLNLLNQRIEERLKSG